MSVNFNCDLVFSQSLFPISSSFCASGRLYFVIVAFARYSVIHMLSTECTGLGGSVGCAVRPETRRSRVQPPPKSATFFRGD